MLTGTGLTLWRGANCLFDQLSFAAAPGGALLIRGPNGSGKTTLLRVIAGLTQAEEGEVRWNGAAVLGRDESGRNIMAYCGHATALKPDLTTLENLRFFARLSGYPTGELAGLLATTGLTACAGLPARVLSAGQKRRAALARVLMSGAPLWLLDEPQTNLDAAGREFLARMLQEHLANSGTAVIVAHQPIDLGSAPTNVLQMGEAA
ncbi:MAG: heme ABC exporter ATP-binding protein CcmA [Gammaproteobacteria bacterium]|nr:heme ABC exporter ATP-binding protein CcmA [Gammaproteobacteria bacterium]